MRHRKGGYKLGRTTAHRAATLRNLAASLFEHGQITTTIPRAKAVQPLVEKIITLAKRNDVHARRLVTAKLGRDRKAFEWLYLPKKPTDRERQLVQDQQDRASAFFDLPEGSLVKRNRYGELKNAPKLVRHIFTNIAPRYASRPGGYTRIVKLGKHRIGDAAELCILQFVGSESGSRLGGNLSQRRRTADKRTAFAAELRKKWAKEGKEQQSAKTTDGGAETGAAST